MIVKAKKGISGYGQAIGILTLDDLYPIAPGDVRNATTYSFPVTFKIVKGATIRRLLYEADLTLAKSFIEAGLELIEEGVRAITGDCGFLALFQKEIAVASPTPVFMSSLMQIPLVSRMLKPAQKVGVITADARQLTKKHFEAVGVDDSISTVITGMENCPEFRKAVLEGEGTFDTDIIEKAIVSVTKKFVSENPEIGAIVLECSSFPPYAAAI